MHNPVLLCMTTKPFKAYILVIVKSEGLQLKMQERECEQSETESENNQL